MKKLILTTLLIIFATHTQAHHDRGYIKARVIEVTPVYEYITVHSPHNNCHHNQDGYYHKKRYHKNHYQSGPAPIIGSVIGGTIGHATSNRKHKFVGTLAGAIIGGAIGHQIERKQDKYRNKHYSNHKHSHSSRKQRVLRGYNVLYKFKGRIYQTFTEDRPKKYLKIYR